MSVQDYAAMDVTYDSGGWIESQAPEVIERLLAVEEKVAFIKRFAPAGARRMLDIGSGMGGYLQAGRRLGMDVLGYEPSAPHSRIARDVFALDVRAEYFTSTDERFDLILLSHVIEHIFEPAPFLEAVVASLAPGGRLLLVTPNAAALSASVTGSRWPMLVPDDHVTMLTPDAMRRIAPAGLALTIQTSEYPHEFFATVGASIKARPATIAGGISPILASASSASKLLKFALTIASLPAHLLAGMTDRRGALIAIFERSA